MMKETKQVINVFWTGGMDSTFNLVRQLMTTSDQVRPHYIVRHENSTGIEIDTMISIRRALLVKYPDFRSRLLPTVYTNEDLIPRFKEIDLEIEELRKEIKINEQYQILAHYCREFNIEQVDLVYELFLDETPEDILLADYFGKSMAFRSFRNPIKNMTKKDCYREAKENGWSEFLLMTSFCRRPKVNIKPCGVCGPCTDAVKNGMGFRLPVIPRIKANLFLPFRSYWRKNAAGNKDSRLFRLIRRKYEGKL